MIYRKHYLHLHMTCLEYTLSSCTIIYWYMIFISDFCGRLFSAILTFTLYDLLDALSSLRNLRWGAIIELAISKRLIRYKKLKETKLFYNFTEGLLIVK